MKNFITKLKANHNLFLGLFLILLFASSCVEELPEANSLEDKTPPTAGFSASSSTDRLLEIKFSNISSSASDFLWDFGDGTTSTDKNPKHTYPDYGKYTVTLTSSDKHLLESMITKEVTVVSGVYLPKILESGFEKESLNDESVGTESWVNPDLGKTIKLIEGENEVSSGKQAVLFEESSTEGIGYQEIVVEAEINYDLTFYYRMNDSLGYLTVSVLSAPVTTHQDALDKTIGFVELNSPTLDEEGKLEYVKRIVSFSSGSSKKVAIYFFNEGKTETRLDDFSFSVVKAGTPKPSVSFDYEQSPTNFIDKFVFTVSSLNVSSYKWDFDDGGTSEEASPEHTFAIAGTYNVSLTASNDEEVTVKFSKTIVFHEVEVEPKFSFVVDPTNSLKITFTDESENAKSWLWDFGDGYLGELKELSHTYSESREYTVVLEATSSSGTSKEITQKIIVGQ